MHRNPSLNRFELNKSHKLLFVLVFILNLKTMKHLFALIPLLVLAWSCNTKSSQNTSTEASTPTWQLTELWRTDQNLLTCESVLFDASRQQLYVSCINGAPDEKNEKGYIAVLGTDGTVKSLDCVSGLNAPKGMGIHGNRLYVCDIDQLVIIDIEAAQIVEKVDVEGASFLNDVGIDASGKVYFTDSDQGAIWTYDQGELAPWITSGLEGPNGLYIETSRILLTSAGTEDLKIIDKETGSFETAATGIGYGDGVEYTGNEGYYLTSSWLGEVFLILPDFSKISLLRTSDQEINSADIGFNTREQVVYVPTFFDNRVVAYTLEKQE